MFPCSCVEWTVIERENLTALPPHGIIIRLQVQYENSAWPQLIIYLSHSSLIPFCPSVTVTHMHDTNGLTKTNLQWARALLAHCSSQISCSLSVSA